MLSFISFTQHGNAVEEYKNPPEVSSKNNDASHFPYLWLLDLTAHRLVSSQQPADEQAHMMSFENY